jgi:hypothetical protein
MTVLSLVFSAIAVALAGGFVLGHLHGRASMAGELFDAQVGGLRRAREREREVAARAFQRAREQRERDLAHAIDLGNKIEPGVEPQ